MNIQGEPIRWDLPLPESVRDMAGKALSSKMGEISKKIQELRSTSEAATGFQDISHKLGLSREAREIKKLERLDKELFETFSALKKGPASDATLTELIAQKKEELRAAAKGPQKTALQAQLKGLELIQSHAPQIAKLEKQQVEERKLLGRASEFIKEPRGSIDEAGLQEALKNFSDTESEETLAENLKELDDFQKKIDDATRNK